MHLLEPLHKSGLLSHTLRLSQFRVEHTALRTAVLQTVKVVPLVEFQSLGLQILISGVFKTLLPTFTFLTSFLELLDFLTGLCGLAESFLLEKFQVLDARLKPLNIFLEMLSCVTNLRDLKRVLLALRRSLWQKLF